MKILRHIVFLELLVCFVFARCSTIQYPQTHFIQSNSMDKKIPVLVFLPDNYSPADQRYPVLYLLHGHSSNYAGWSYIQPDLLKWVNQNQIILVCPDGESDSWYLDSPVEKDIRYETFISKELTAYIDQLFATQATHHYRGITGISMGGHGAVSLSLKHPETFGVCGSISGALDLFPFEEEWNLSSLLGPLKEHREKWNEVSSQQLLENKLSLCIPMRIDCGSEDFFIDVNRRFHQSLNKRNCLHEYHEKQGAHTMEYWTRVFPEHLEFFSSYWDKPPQKFK